MAGRIVGVPSLLFGPSRQVPGGVAPDHGPLRSAVPFKDGIAWNFLPDNAFHPVISTGCPDDGTNLEDGLMQAIGGVVGAKHV